MKLTTTLQVCRPSSPPVGKRIVADVALGTAAA